MREIEPRQKLECVAEANNRRHFKISGNYFRFRNSSNIGTIVYVHLCCQKELERAKRRVMDGDHSIVSGVADFNSIIISL